MPKHLSFINTTIVIVIITIALLMVVVAVWYENSDKGADQTAETTTVGSPREGDYFDMGNGYYSTIPMAWMPGSNMRNAANIVEGGSPATVTTLTPIDVSEDIYTPTITVTTFTVDRTLSVRAIAGKIHSREIPDIISSNADPCYNNLPQWVLDGFDIFSYQHDRTNPEQCAETITEPGLSETIVMTPPDSGAVCMVTLSVGDNLQYERYQKDLRTVVNSFYYQ